MPKPPLYNINTAVGERAALPLVFRAQLRSLLEWQRTGTR